MKGVNTGDTRSLDYHVKDSERSESLEPTQGTIEITVSEPSEEPADIQRASTKPMQSHRLPPER